MARTLLQRKRDAAEYQRNRDIILEGHPPCALCDKPMIFKGDTEDPKWWLRPMAATVDHIIPLHEGGSNRLSNLRPAHRSCNSKLNRRRGADLIPRRIKAFGRPRLTTYD